MATLLGTWELGFGYGHIAHLAPLAHALNARGHRMAVAARNPATAGAASGQPFAAIAEAPRYRPPPAPPKPTLTYAQVIADGGFADAAAAVQLVRLWLGLFDRVKPAAIVAEHAPMSLLAAHVAGLPAAMVGAAFAVPPAMRPLPSLLPWLNKSEADRGQADAAADETVRAVCAAFGVRPLDGLAELLATARPYLTTWPELDIYGPRDGVTYYGAMGGFTGRAHPEWPAGEGPRIFVYLPFEHPRGSEAVAALSALGWPTIWHAAKASTEPMPANIRFSPEPVDLSRVLAEARLLVGRAAHGTACTALAAGRPHVVLPDLLDTVLTARCIVANGLGAVAVEPGVAGVRLALERVAGDEAMAAHVAALGRRYAGYRPEFAAGQLAQMLVRDLKL